MSRSFEPASKTSLQILLSVLCTALAYFAVGLPLAVLPRWVHQDLGYSAVIAGLAISIQYVATIVSRGLVGPMADSSGPHRSILLGFSCCMASGLSTILAGHLSAMPGLALGAMFLGRILLGFCESWVGTSAIAWGIGRVGTRHTAKIISWNGIATYGAIALGAPIGTWLYDLGGMVAIGVALTVTALAGLAFTWPQTATKPIVAERLKFHSVFTRVLPYGAALACGAVGFGVIASFVALYYSSRGWTNAWVAVSAFGCFFVISRLIFIQHIERHGGLKVALAFLCIEAAGLFLVWCVPAAWSAVLGAGATGFGFALIFPALGMTVVDLVPPQSRGAAIGAYSMFTDVALCATGPIAGFLAAHAGYDAPFLFGAVSALAVIILVAALLRTQANAVETHPMSTLSK